MTKGKDSSTTKAGDIEGDLVKQLADILNETNLSEIEYETGPLKIRVARQMIVETFAAPQTPASPPPPLVQPEPSSASPSPTDPSTHPGTVKAPMVGVAYLAGEPDSPPYVKVGDSVTEGQTLMLIEAMKTFNPVRAPKAGTVSAILVTDGQPIEFDQPLVTID